MEHRRPIYSAALAGRSTYLLIALLALMFAYPFILDGSLASRLILGFLNVVIMVSSAYAAAATRRTFLLVVLFLGLPVLGLQVLYLTTGSVVVFHLLFVNYLALYTFTVGHVLRYVLGPGQVTVDKIHGAISAYILIGLLWAWIYTYIDFLNPGSFAYQGAIILNRPLRIVDFAYFSFATLTTTGYGDIAPVTAHARSMAILEQLTGTFFIAILIARLTGLYRGRSALD